MQDFDPHRLTAEEDPYPVYREMREKHPIYYSDERKMWLVSRYADVRAVLLDACDQAARISDGEVSPLELLE